MSVLIDASRFVGRPAKPCRKCKGVQFFVNEFGGLECSQCNAPGDQPKLYVVAGQWSDAPDEWGVSEQADCVTYDSATSGETTEKTGQYNDLFLMNLPDDLDRELTWQDADAALADLIDWYHDNRMFLPTEPFKLHVPGRRARSLRDLNDQLSPQVSHPIEFYRAMDIEIDVQGVRGPRVRTGTLKADLRRLKEVCEL